MPQFKISGRELTDLEAFVTGCEGIVDQVKALRCLEILVVDHEAMAIRAARDQWMKDLDAKLEVGSERPVSFDLPPMGVDCAKASGTSKDFPCAPERAVEVAEPEEAERASCQGCGRVEGHTPGCPTVPSLTPLASQPPPAQRTRVRKKADRKKKKGR